MAIVDKYDGITIGDFVTERFLEGGGSIVSKSLGVLYSAQLSSGKNAQDDGVKNAGVTVVYE
jgi:hypothetical protein